MQAITLLQAQLNAIHQILHDCADDLTEAEWISPALAGTDALGFTCWHLVRTQDWAVQTAIRGIPEVIADKRWTAWSDLTIFGMGAGITSTQAQEIARRVSRDDVLAYADTVHETLGAWLRQMNDDDLTTVPAMEANMSSYPAYQEEGFRTEIAHLFDQPIWRLLSGPCIGHIREHFGELFLLKQILRGKVRQI